MKKQIRLSEVVEALEDKGLHKTAENVKKVVGQSKKMGRQIFYRHGLLKFYETHVKKFYPKGLAALRVDGKRYVRDVKASMGTTDPAPARPVAVGWDDKLGMLFVHISPGGSAMTPPSKKGLRPYFPMLKYLRTKKIRVVLSDDPALNTVDAVYLHYGFGKK